MRAVLVDVDNRAEIECLLSPAILPAAALAELKQVGVFYLEFLSGSSGKVGDTVCGIWPPPHWPAEQVAQLEAALGIGNSAHPVPEAPAGPYRHKRVAGQKRSF